MRCILRYGQNDGRTIEAEPDQDEVVYRDGGEVYVLTRERDDQGRWVATLMWD